MQDTDFVNGLLSFLQCSPTPFHAVNEMSAQLEDKGFQRLLESDAWTLQANGRYYVTRNDSSIIAFTLNKALLGNGFRMMGAHTDSPCLKVKPNPEVIKHNYLQLGVEVYGGALLNPWFDRDLSLAGKVSFIDKKGVLQHALVDFEKAVAVIPSLAIHLDREANSKRSINAQKHMPPVLMKLPEVLGEASTDTKNNTGTKADFRKILLSLVQAQHAAMEAETVLDYELSFYDVQPPAVIGLHDDFISSARLDNLLSCYTALQALLDDGVQQNSLLVCNDHEEVGSMSSSGAQGPFLKSVLERICQSEDTEGGENGSVTDSSLTERYLRIMDSSMMISADNAHAVHPNYADKHDENHGPLLNNGPVIKMNANQRYATNSETSAIFKQLCEQADVPVQSFVVRSDMACGSTIGPITAAEIGLKTLDVGVPTFAMHSIRELAGRWDAYYLYRVLKQYCQ